MAAFAGEASATAVTRGLLSSWLRKTRRLPCDRCRAARDFTWASPASGLGYQRRGVIYLDGLDHRRGCARSLPVEGFVLSCEPRAVLRAVRPEASIGVLAR
jgi:hypothetical protein